MIMLLMILYRLIYDYFSSHHNEEFRVKMADMENKIKKEAEMREEALLKRISEKDKQITKMKWVEQSVKKLNR